MVYCKIVCKLPYGQVDFGERLSARGTLCFEGVLRVARSGRGKVCFWYVCQIRIG